MPTTPEQCANHAINQQMCPCVKLNCANHGICCQCLQAHAAKNGATSCMRGAKRDPATLALAQLAVAPCAVNYEGNLAFCNCTAEACGNQGTCCSCIRNHFSTDGSGRTACMRAFA